MGKKLRTMWARFIMGAVTVAAVSLAVTALGPSNPAFAVQPGKDVNVVNTPDVAVVNTPDVAVVNTPDVAVVNTPDVAVVNIPDVAVVNIPEVEVVNGNPIPVIVVQSPREPFQQNFSTTLSHGDPGVAFQLGTTPYNKLKVIETITIIASLPSGQSATAFSISTLVNGQHANHWIPLFMQSPTENTYVGALSVSIYSDPSTSGSMTFLRDSDQFGGTVQVSLSGHFEPPPEY